MRIRVLFIWLLFLSLTASGAQRVPDEFPPDELLQRINGDSIRTRMNFLADDLLEGRATGSPGYLRAATFNHDGYRGVDVTGKLVAMLYGAPSRFAAAPRAHYSDSAVKAETAASHGAVGVITIWAGPVEKDAPFAEIVRFSHQLRMRWLDRNGTPNDTFPALRAPGTVISAATATSLFQGAPRSFAQALDAAAASTP